ncbi:hypothetical protein [Insolitispirillum peregrinum]|uniref:Uncharacterized protein n=1 Tax=Insolitispirillum peregrinum TaxID=80876 RepID=A0A1N7L7B1_9PROT|nr:hypothetical protein [Insolitispirillum peregrinum]SIS69725.1 hypothetical protein SAMN05421779_103155 [Insolitispirillum peregrinum]
MSTSLNLVIYQRNGDDLVEEGMRTARCEQIPLSTLNTIREKFPSQKRNIYYDGAKEDFFEIDYFARDDVPKIINWLRIIFNNLLIHEYKLLNSEADTPFSQPKDSNLTLFNNLPSQRELDPTSVAIAKFRILISLIDIFSEMQAKYVTEPGAILKLG